MYLIDTRRGVHGTGYTLSAGLSHQSTSISLFDLLRSKSERLQIGTVEGGDGRRIVGERAVHLRDRSSLRAAS